MTKDNISFSQFKIELEKYYSETLRSNPLRIFHTFKETRKHFRDQFGISRKLFEKYMNVLHDDWRNTGMRFYGAIPSEFTKDKWLIATDERKYILWGFSGKIRPDLNQYSTVIQG